jgi:hypothetical protein
MKDGQLFSVKVIKGVNDLPKDGERYYIHVKSDFTLRYYLCPGASFN